MPTAHVLLKKDYESKNNTYPIIIRLKDGKKVKVHNTKYKVKESQFKNGVVSKHGDADLINSVISDKVNKAKKYFADCVINERPVNLNAVFLARASSNFCQYVLHRAEQYKKKGVVIMWQKLTRFEKELTACFSGQIYMDEVTIDRLRIFESYLVNNGNHANTIAKKFRFLKQLFQSAIDEGLHIGVNPFKNYKIQTYPTKKEKLTAAEITAIENLELSGLTNDVKNLALFSYYAKGARFENCIFLRSEQVRDGRIYFTTNKGRKHISVLIHSRLQKILDVYFGQNLSKFIFPFVVLLPEDPFEYRSLKDSLNSVVNRELKIIQGLAKIKTKLTFHIFRHSAATAMMKAGVDIHGIKNALGHSDTRTTEIYLQSLDDEQLDEEMKKVYGE
ncbi:MAG: hypothetical protein JWO92_2487 [Chitinophagaceae bacterium]|nr:hypothetical protein [Chitinophagaceae bacterium]